MVPRYFCCVAVLLFTASCQRKDVAAASKQAGSDVVNIQVATVTARDVSRVVETVGTLYPYDETVISAEIDGRLDEVKADLGDAVKQGDVLVHISDEEQRYMVAQNEAQLRQSLERLGLTDENEKLKDIKAAPDPRKAEAELYDAETRYKRQRQLTESGIGAPADMDQAQARFRAAQAAYDSTLFATRNLVQEVERFKAQLELQRKKLRDTSVRAPFTGSVKERSVNVGQYVRVNTPLFTLVKTDPLRLKLEVPERMAPWIKNGQIVEVDLEAYEGRHFEGKIWRISPTVDQQKRTFVVEALVSNSAGQLKPGSYARARVPTQKIERTMLVPARAVNYVFGSNKVFVVKSGVIEAKEVKTGDRVDNNIEIVEGGIQEGQQVAVSQLPKLDTGVRVHVSTDPSSDKKGL
jgi:RND family efflux transporter MFP subunit